MSTLEEEIAALKNEINDYRVQLNIAIAERNDVREERYAGLITSARNNLLELQKQQREERQLLLLQQQQGNRGNFFYFKYIILSECDR